MVMKFFAAILLSLLVSACATKPEASSPPPPLTAVPKTDAGAALVQQAGEAVAAKRPAQALLLADKAIAYYESTYRKSDVLAYASRSAPESLLYAMQGYKEKTPAQVYGIEWSLAYFLKGFALVDLHRIPEARAAYDAAIKLSPRNSAYLSERAEADIAERNWQSALEIFQKALDATDLSPPERKTAETTRALRGMAFAQIELGNLDMAKALHERVLQLDPGNEKSLNELRYIQNQKTRYPDVLVPVQAEAVSVFTQANYLRVVIKQRQCDAMDGPLVVTTNARFEAARKGIAARYGESFFAANQATRIAIADAPCDRRALDLYQQKVQLMESFLQRQK